MDDTLRISYGPFGRVSLATVAQSCVEHVHSQGHIIVKCGGDDLVHLIDGTPVVLGDTSATLINPWQRHASNPEPAGKAVLLIVGLSYDWGCGVLEKEDPDGYGFVFSAPSAPLSHGSQTHVRALAECMSGFTRPDADVLQKHLEGLLLSLWASAHIARTGKAHAVIRRDQLDRRIRIALKAVSEQDVPGWSVRSLAAEAGLSRSRFFALFRAATGISPIQYKDYLRLEASIRLLTTTDETLGQLAGRMGFSAQSHFSRFIKQHLGYPPAHLRRYSSGCPERAATLLSSPGLPPASVHKPLKFPATDPFK